MNDFDRGFIVALVEGEGTITLMAQKHDRKKYVSFSLHPIVNISNTSKILIDKANNILKGSLSVAKRGGKRKPCYRIAIFNIDYVKAFLDETINDFVCKRRQAELVLEFCNIRLQKKILNNGDNKHMPYGKREFEILKDIRLLNVPKAGYRHPELDKAIEQRVELFKSGYMTFKQKNDADTYIEKKCLFCEKPFKVRKFHSGIRKFCSKECNGLARRAKQLGLSYTTAHAKWILKLRPAAFRRRDEIFG